MSEEQKITIDGREFNLADLSEEARQQLVNIRFVDQEVAQLQRQLAIAQTARAAYARALNKALGLDSDAQPPVSDEDLSFNFS